MTTQNEASTAGPTRLAVPGHITGATGTRFVITPTGATLFAVMLTAIVWQAPMLGAYLAIISTLVVLHEWAHMFVARRCGLAVSEFAVGFGPVVGSVHARGLDWSLRAIPAGGFVRILGPTEASEVPEGIPEATTLRGTTRARRVATIAAGPVANLIAAVALSTFAFGVIGTPTAEGTQRLAAYDAVIAGVNDLTVTATATLGGLVDLLGGADEYTAAVIAGDRGDAPAGFLSPVGAADVLGGLDHPSTVLRFAAIISASLGVFNLLPFPPLDGGHLAVEAISAIRSRIAGRYVRVSLKAQNIAAAVTLGFFLVMTLAALRLDLAAGI